MDRVGGYRDLLALEADARAYDHVVIILQAEAEAEKLRRMQEQAGGQ